MADVSVSLDLDAQQLYSELAQVQSHFATFASKTVSEGEQASRGFVSGFGRGFGSLGTNIVQGLAAAGIGNELRTIVEKFSQIEDVGIRFGVPVEGLQRIANAAEKMGVPLEGVAKSFRFLELARDKALAGNEQFVKSFTDAGVSMEQLKSIRIEDLFVQVGGHAINAVEGVKLFGRAFADIRPVAEGLAQGTLKFGEALSAIDVKRIKEADDAFKTLRQTLDIGLGAGIAAVTRSWQAFVAEATGGILEIVADVKGVASVIAIVFSTAFDAATSSAEGFAKVAGDLIKGHFSEALSDAKSATSGNIDILKKGIEDAQKEFGKYGEEAKAARESGHEVAQSILRPEVPTITPRPIPAEEESKKSQDEREKAADEREKNILKLSGVREGRGTAGTGTGGTGTGGSEGGGGAAGGGGITPSTLQQEIAKTEQGISAIQSPSERIDDYHAKQQAATDKYYADQKKATEEYNKQQRVEHPELDAGAERRTQLEALQSRLSVLKEGAEAGAKVQEIKSAPIEELLREIKENTKDATANK